MSGRNWDVYLHPGLTPAQQSIVLNDSPQLTLSAPTLAYVPGDGFYITNNSLTTGVEYLFYVNAQLYTNNFTGYVPYPILDQGGSYYAVVTVSVLTGNSRRTVTSPQSNLITN